MAGRLDLEVVDRQPRRRRAAAALPALARRSTRPAGEMRVTVVDSGSPDSTPDMVEREFPAVRLLRREQHRLLGRQQPGPARERGARRCCCSTPTPRSTRGRSTRRWRGCAPSERIGMVGVKLVTESRRARPRLQALLPHPAQRPRPLHRDRPLRRRLRRPQPVPGDPAGRRRAGRGRRRQRRLHALPGRGGARGRPARRGLLALHGGPRLVPPLLGRRLEGLLRAGRASPCTSRAAPAAAAAPPARRSPSTAAWAASTAASTPPSTTRSSTPPSTPASAPNWPPAWRSPPVRGRAGD